MITPEGVGLPPRSIGRFVLDDERLVLATRHHWARLLEPVSTAVLSFLGVAVVASLARPTVGDAADVLWFLWLVVLGRTLLRVIAWQVEWFVATDKRMLMLTGLITHRVAMMPLAKVTDMSYSRSPLGRILGFGEFVLESAGQDQAMRRITYVPDPDRSYRTLCATMFTPASAPGAGATTESKPKPPVVMPANPRPRPGDAEPLEPEAVTEDIPVVGGDDGAEEAGADASAAGPSIGAGPAH